MSSNFFFAVVVLLVFAGLFVDGVFVCLFVFVIVGGGLFCLFVLLLVVVVMVVVVVVVYLCGCRWGGGLVCFL